MSVERKDIRGKLDPDMHRAFKIFCDVDGLTEAEFIERVLVPVIERRVHEAIQAADALRDAGITGKNRE